MSGGHGAAPLRNRFDDADHVWPRSLPRTHHREYYLATDGSVVGEEGRLGAVLETIDGIRVGAWARSAPVADNNDAELKALHWGLDLFADRTPAEASLGIVVDHEALGRAVAAACERRDRMPESPVPSASDHHWGGILARVHRSGPVGVGLVTGDRNPAHPVANAGRGLGAPTGGDRCVRAGSSGQRSGQAESAGPQRL